MADLIRIAALLGLVACGADVPTSDALLEVTRGPLVYTGSLHGELHATNSVPVFAPQTGDWSYFTVQTVLPDGTEVSEGDVILTFQTGPAADELQSAQTDLDVAEAELRRTEHGLRVEYVGLDLEVKRAELALERAQLDVVEGTTIISELQLRKNRLEVQRAEVELDLAKSAVATFEKKRRTSLEVQKLKVDAALQERDEKAARVAAMEVRAPADGVVYGPYVTLNWRRTKVAPGKVAAPGDKVLEIPDLSELEAHVYARQRDGVIIEEGDRATVIPTARPDLAIEATVKRKEAFATTRNERLGTDTPEGNLKEVLVVLELDETPPGLAPGATLRAEVHSALVDDAVLVPMAALVSRAGGAAVTLADGSTRPVEVGRTTPLQAEVLSGIGEGDRVWLRGEVPDDEDGPPEAG